MKIKVLIGSVRLDKKVYGVGQTLEIDEVQAKAIIREGVAEEFVQEVAKPEAKAEKPKKVEVKKKEVVKAEVKEVEPTIDWTAKEILEYGISIGVEDLDGKTKEDMLKIIKESKK
jgi:D-aminopeptidase